MPSADAKHFDEYPEQTRLKHQILSKYYKPYVTVLKNRVNWYHYIDGFAGRGEYEGGNPGSPLIAMDVLYQAGVIQRSAISLVESRQSFFDELDRRLTASDLAGQLFQEPYRKCAPFGEQLPQILKHPIYSQAGEVATFSFVDPCGVKGVKLSDLVELLQQDYGELLLFFNYSGVNRIMGALGESANKEIMTDLFGSEDRVDALSAKLRELDAELREVEIMSTFVNTLRELSSIEYFMPFRFDAKGRQRTSHYVIHYCRNQLGFTIMKDVMWNVSKGNDEEYGRPEYALDQQGERQQELFRDDIQKQKKAIVAEIKECMCQVKRFTKEWVARYDDYFCISVYKQMLKDLERDGVVVVYDKKNESPCPADKRRRDTLGDDYWLRLEQGG